MEKGLSSIFLDHRIKFLYPILEKNFLVRVVFDIDALRFTQLYPYDIFVGSEFGLEAYIAVDENPRGLKCFISNNSRN